MSTTSASGTFASADVANGITVQVADLALTGTTQDGTAASVDYTLTQPTTMANITPAALTVSAITANNAVYNGTPAATITSSTLVGVVSGDAVSLTGTATFASVSVGANLTVTDSSLGLTGADAGNYVLETTSITTTASITAASLTITASPVTGVYGSVSLNGSTGFTACGLQNGETIGSVNLETNATLSSSNNDNVGTWTITPSAAEGGTFTASNYSITYNTGTLTVTPFALTVSATGVNKVYDGTTTATATLSDNRVSGDVFTDSYSSAVFSDANVGNDKAVSVSGITISGTDAGNYTLASSTAATTANITAATLTVTANCATSVYGEGPRYCPTPSRAS